MDKRLTLEGCAPSPLAAYLKALGILRLISTPANHVSGEAADPTARGWWAHESFHLSTALDEAALVQFFLDDYAPTPIIAPWNGGSGFYEGDNRDGFDPLTAKEIAPRFESLSGAIRTASAVIQSRGLKKRPKDEAKQQLVAQLRGGLPDSALAWIDAALALSGRELRYPQLLGTGGNDGRLDFTNNFLRRLVSQKRPKIGLFDASSGAPREDASVLLDAALFDAPSPKLLVAPIGQFSPGNAGGANATTGFGTKGAINPWDFVLMLEGSVSFAGAATRRHESGHRSSGSFPFTVGATGAGSGVADATDEADARAEFWAPLWSRPVTQTEVEALFAEGRAVLNGKTARDGLDFARAAASLGVSRGFSEFARYGFFKRAGNQYLATPLGRCAAHPSRGAELAADLDVGGWLDSVRRIARAPESPRSARQIVKRLEDSILALVASEAEPKRVETALTALGRVAEWLASRKKYRDEVGSPPPGLRRAWLQRTDDGSPEFHVAVALAGLGHSARRDDADRSSEAAGGEEDSTAARETDLGSKKSEKERPPPMAAHWAPVSEEPFLAGRRRTWALAEKTPTVVWGPASLVSNVGAVLERRLMEMAMRGLQEKPLGSRAPARLRDIAAFLARDFDDARCADLLGGLIWVRPDAFTWKAQREEREHRREIPFAYAALKPVFCTDGALRRLKILEAKSRMPIPPGVVARLRSAPGGHDGRRIEEAVRSALARARGSGLASPFDRASRAANASNWGGSLAAERLAASLLIPINDSALKALLKRAYGYPKEELDDAA